MASVLTALFVSTPDYFLRVNDNSLDLVGFRPGDTVAVSKSHPPQNGDIVIARIGKAAMLRRYRASSGNGNARLQQVSRNHSGTIPTSEDDDLEIAGVVVVVAVAVVTSPRDTGVRLAG